MNIKSVSSKVEKFKPSKKVVIGAVIVGVFALLFLFGMYEQVKKDNQDRAVMAAQTAEFNDLKAKNPQLQARVTELEKKLAATTTEKQVGCDLLKSLSTARSTKSLVVVPVTMHCTN